MRLVDIWKSFGAVQSLRGVSMDIMAGETFGLLEFPVANGQRPRAWREPLQIDADATMISTLAWFRAWLRSGGGEASLTKMSIASSGAI